MAKAGKISTDLLADFATEKNKKTKRPFGKLPKRRYYLIVCEGEKTEPNYFEALR